MDPNETLHLLRDTLQALKENQDPHDYPAGAVEALMTSAQTLDNWLSKGGALPAHWTRNRPEQLFEVRLHCDGASLVVGRYFDYAKALAHVGFLKKHEKELALLGALGADVVPAEVVP